MLLYLKVPEFVGEWLVFHYGNPVKFPDGSVENSIIRLYLTKTPHGAVPKMKQEGDVSIVIPETKAKKLEVYNYFTPRGKEAVLECIEDNFRRCLWNELWDLYEKYDREGKKFKMMTHIRAWCELHGIAQRHASSIKQRFYRIRDAYKKKDVNFMRNSRNKDENLK